MQAWKPKPAINSYARWQRKSKVMAAIMSSVEIQVWVEIKSRKSSALRSRTGLLCVNAFVRKTQYRQNRFTRNSMRDMFLWRFRVSLIAKISEYRLLYCSEKKQDLLCSKKSRQYMIKWNFSFGYWTNPRRKTSIHLGYKQKAARFLPARKTQWIPVHSIKKL